MQITGKKGIGYILGKILKICFWSGIILLIILPFILHKFGLNLSASALIIYPNGIVLLIIVHKFIELFDSLKNNIPFCEKNIEILKNAGIIAGVGATCWILDLMYEVLLARVYDVVVILILVFLFILYLGVSIALYILSELFKQATKYKKENELTI